MADARMIFIENTGKTARTVHVSRAILAEWMKHLPGSASVGFRRVDVGMPVSSQVIVVSHHEASVATAELKKESGDEYPAKKKFCGTVETLIKTDDPVSFFGAWIIVETATIDP
jgi:hypothetical protein